MNTSMNTAATCRKVDEIKGIQGDKDRSRVEFFLVEFFIFFFY